METSVAPFQVPVRSLRSEEDTPISPGSDEVSRSWHFDHPRGGIRQLPTPRLPSWRMKELKTALNMSRAEHPKRSIAASRRYFIASSRDASWPFGVAILDGEVGLDSQERGSETGRHGREQDSPGGWTLATDSGRNVIGEVVLPAACSPLYSRDRYGFLTSYQHGL